MRFVASHRTKITSDDKGAGGLTEGLVIWGEVLGENWGSASVSVL